MVLSIYSSEPASADSLVGNLRRRTLGELVDSSFRIYRRHFLTMLTIMAVVYVPAQLIIVALSIDRQLASRYAFLPTNASGSDLLLSFFLSLPQAALAVAATAALTGGVVRFGTSYGTVLAMVGRLFFFMLLQLLFAVFVSLPNLLASTTSGGGASRSSGSSSLGLLVSCLVLPLALARVRLQVALPALVLEGLGPVEALRRSWELTRSYWWRTFILQILVALLVVVLYSGLLAVLGGVVSTVVRVDAAITTTLSRGVQVVVLTLMAPVEALATTLYYLDQRVRKEGFDLEAAIESRYPALTQYPSTPAAMAHEMPSRLRRIPVWDAKHPTGEQAP